MIRATSRFLTSLAVLGLLWTAGASAQTVTPPTPQFDFLGMIQEATLDTTGTVCTPAQQFSNQDPLTGVLLDVSRLRGGTITVNGVKMIVPCNTLLQLPANTMMWADLFQAWGAPYDPLLNPFGPVGTYIGAPAAPVAANPVVANVKTGLALADYPTPFPSFEVRVQGNVVKNAVTGVDEYIAGLIIPITQQGLNIGSGLVSYIDYTIGAFRVGGIPNDPNCATITSPLCSGALVQINDAVGRWGLVHSPDPRFQGDNENVTVHASTGIPVCIPRVAPPSDDPLCPLKNRPLNGDPNFPQDRWAAPGAPLKVFDMPAPVLQTQVVPVIDPVTGTCVIDPVTLVCQTQTVTVIDPVTGVPVNLANGPDAYRQVPIMVGDQVNYSGTLYKIDPLLTMTDPVTLAIIPDNRPSNTYVSAHTVEDVLGIFTAPGIPPAYVFVEAVLIGTGGAAIQGILQEASTRLTVVGFTTDPTRLVEINAVDVNPCTGQESSRLLAITDPATQPLRGRFVHRVLGGLFMPPTRMYRMVSQTQKIDPVTLQRVPLVAANGIVTGEFSLPNFEYIFPENHGLGDPIIPFNFQDLPFLALGSGPLDGFGTGATSPILGQLSPWPGARESAAPAPLACSLKGTQPIANAGPDFAVAAGASVTLRGTVTFDAVNSDPLTRTVSWAQIDNGAPVVTLTPNNTTVPPGLNATFTAPTTPGLLVFSLTGTDNIGTGTDSMVVNVMAQTDIVQITLATWLEQRGPRGGFGKLTASATSTDPTAQLSLRTVSVPDPVTGVVTTSDWGTGSTSPSTPGVYDWREVKGVPQPALVIVTSNKGGSAQSSCGQPSGRANTVTCP